MCAARWRRATSSRLTRRSAARRAAIPSPAVCCTGRATGSSSTSSSRCARSSTRTRRSTTSWRSSCAPYGVRVVYSDRFAKDFVTDRLRHHGSSHEMTDFDRSAAYLAALPWITSERLELPDPRVRDVAQRCVTQFTNLQRKTGSSGKTRSIIRVVDMTIYRITRWRSPCSRRAAAFGSASQKFCTAEDQNVHRTRATDSPPVHRRPQRMRGRRNPRTAASRPARG